MMKKISCWCKENPGKARVMIGIIHVLLGLIGVATGIFTYLHNIYMAGGALMVIAFSIAYLMYPVRGRKEGLFKYSYNRRIKHDIILLTSSIWVLASGVNHFAFQPLQSIEFQPQVSLMIAKQGSFKLSSSLKESKKGFTSQIKELRKNLKQQLKSMKSEVETNDSSKGALKALLIFLTLLGAAGLIMLLGAAACQLACSGNTGGAYVLIFGGTIGTVFLAVVSIKRIAQIGRKEPVPAPDAEDIISNSGV